MAMMLCEEKVQSIPFDPCLLFCGSVYVLSFLMLNNSYADVKLSRFTGNRMTGEAR